jgi:hypothetical protein
MQPGVVRVTGVGAVVTERDQAETLRVAVLQDVLDQSRQWYGQRCLPCFGPLAQGDGAETFPHALNHLQVSQKPLVSFTDVPKMQTLPPS